MPTRDAAVERIAATQARSFFGMAAMVFAYATGILQLGSHPWLVLGLIAAVGNAIIWWWSERVLGTYFQHSEKVVTRPRTAA